MWMLHGHPGPWCLCSSHGKGLGSQGIVERTRRLHPEITARALAGTGCPEMSAGWRVPDQGGCLSPLGTLSCSPKETHGECISLRSPWASWAGWPLLNLAGQVIFQGKNQKELVPHRPGFQAPGPPGARAPGPPVWCWGFPQWLEGQPPPQSSGMPRMVVSSRPTSPRDLG